MDKSNYNDHLYTTMCNERTLQSDKNGFFLQFADHVVFTAGSEWLNDKFSKLKTDRQRIETLFKDDQIKNVVCDTLLNVQCMYRKKDARISREKRLEGEDFMKNGNTNKALMLFCQSVLRAPSKDNDSVIDEGRSLALAYWQRSLALMTLGHIKPALNDMQLSQKEGLPDAYRPELYARLAECYYATGESGRAKIAAELAKKLGVSKITVTILRMTKERAEPSMPEVTKGGNDQLECASSLVEVKQSLEMGRFVVAKGDVSTGDALIVEPPYAACLLPECFGSHCHHCFKRLLAPIGCQDCAGLAFCSTECRDTSLSTYHRHECKILDLLMGSGMSILCHVALRMVTQDQQKGASRSDRVYKLCGHSERREPKDQLQRCLMAAFLLRCLQSSGYFGDGRTVSKTEINLSEEELNIGELLLTNLQILQFNAHEVYETRRTTSHKFKGSRPAYIGIGLYPTVALLNHECHPAVIRYFVGRNIVIRAVRPLRPGEMVAENYGPIFLKKTLPERQRALLSRYWFKCECQACREDWPCQDKLTNNHMRYRCLNTECNFLFAQPSKELITCPNCKQKIHFKQSLEKIKTGESQYNAGMIAMDKQEPEKAIPLFCTAIDTFHSIVCPPHKTTHLCQEALKTCLAHSGNVSEI